MKSTRVAIVGIVLALLLPLAGRSAAPAGAGMPDLSDQAMGNLMGMNDATALGKVMLDQLEAEGGSGVTLPAWDGNAWYGGDYNKIWFKSEGSPDSSLHDTSRNELLWDHVITRWWDLQTGVRYDLGSGPARGWAALGVAGLAPYWSDVEATLYLGEAGRSAARLRVEHDLLITQQWILQPEIETNFYGKSDAARDVRSGLSDMQLGLRMRYEIRREFAPYVGIAWRRNLYVLAPVARGGGPGAESVLWVAGFRVWL